MIGPDNGTQSKNAHGVRSTRWYRPLVDLVFPRACVLCQASIEAAELEALCADCLAKIGPSPRRCLRCSALVPQSHAKGLDVSASKCIHCKSKRWAFRRAYCYATYGGECAQAIKKMKRPAYESIAIQLSQVMADWLKREPTFDGDAYQFIVPIPQHWFRRLTVRYNQAETIAEILARSLEIPIVKNRLVRSRWTEKQGTKSLPERLKDVQFSFACKSTKDLQGASVLLVDDVVTSGATANDAARALRAAGASRVDVAAIARAVGKKSER